MSTDTLTERLKAFADLPLEELDAEKIAAIQADCAAAAEALDIPEITWPYTFTFKRPATALGQQYDGLELKEPTALDFLEFGVLDGSAVGERQLALLARLSGKGLPTIKALPGTEMLRLLSRLTDFFRLEGR